MTRLELASCCTLAAFAVLSTSAAAAPPKKKPWPAPAASAPPAPASASAPPAPAPAPSQTAATATVTDEEGAHATAPSSEGEKKITVGADLLFVLPFGNLSDVSGPQIGPLLRGGYRVMPPLEVTARIGYLFAFSKTQNLPGGGTATGSVSNLPIWLGARYFLTEAPAGPYAAAEIGMNFLFGSVTVNGTNQSLSSTDTRAGFNLGVGYVISKDLPIDMRLQYSYFNLIGANTGANAEGAIWGFGLSAGYSFFL